MAPKSKSTLPQPAKSNRKVLYDSEKESDSESELLLTTASSKKRKRGLLNSPARPLDESLLSTADSKKLKRGLLASQTADPSEETSEMLHSDSESEDDDIQGVSSKKDKAKEEEADNLLEALLDLEASDLDSGSDSDEGDDTEDEEDSTPSSPSGTSAQSESEPGSKYLSFEEVAELRQFVNLPYRQVLEAIHPPSEEEQKRMEEALPGSSIHKFRQMFHQFAAIYFAAFEKSRFKPGTRDLFGKGRVSEIERCHLTRSEMIDAALKGIPECVQAHYGGDNPFDCEAIVANFPRANEAFWIGGYIGIARWTDLSLDDQESVYHGQTVATLANRMGTHEIAIMCANKKKQPVHHVFREAKDLGGRYDFRVTHLHPDNTPSAVITMCEAFFLLKFGRVRNGNPRTDGTYSSEIQRWITKLQGDCKPPKEWVVVNNSLPTKEPGYQVRRDSVGTSRGPYRRGRAIYVPGIKCWWCKDSRELAQKHSSKVELFTKAGLIWCGRCKDHISVEKRLKPMRFWKTYLYPSLPECLNCKSQDGSSLIYMKDASTWETSFRCRPCQMHCKQYNAGKRTEPEKTERRWLDHLRRRFRCEHCGKIEGQVTFSYNMIHRSPYMICEGCNTVRNGNLSRQYPQWADGDERAATAPAPIPLPPPFRLGRR